MYGWGLRCRMGGGGGGERLILQGPVLTLYQLLQFGWRHQLQCSDAAMGGSRLHLDTLQYQIISDTLPVNYTVEPGYNDIGLHDISPIASYILWYQLTF
jgi:hypothetical protein